VTGSKENPRASLAVGFLGTMGALYLTFVAYNAFADHFIRSPREEKQRAEMNVFFNDLVEEDTKSELGRKSLDSMSGSAKADGIFLPSHPRRLKKAPTEADLVSITRNKPHRSYRNGMPEIGWMVGKVTTPRILMVFQLDGGEARCLVRTVFTGRDEWEETVCTDYDSWKFYKREK
jgi:hypothetical protein